MKDALKKQFRELFENEYPGMETLREKLIKPLWTEVGTPSLVVPIEQNDTNKIKKITIFANQGSDINFVDVELSDTIVLKRNRATINRYITNKIVDVYQSALIFFHYENNQNEWRISYVYKGENNSDRTNAKRYTYLCGKGNYCRTAAERFSELIKTNGYPDNDDMMNAFSVAALTTEFFTQLFKWYDTWACNVCKFPSKNCIAANAELTTENNQIQLIRLITRLIFVWFIKQKDLIPSWIFDRNELKNILAEYDLDSDKKGNYYNAVLQNLFFGALNKKIQERDFAEKSFDGIPNEQYGIKSYFRDDNNNSFFKLSHSEIKKYFEGVPFLNGGLFECLDWDEPIKNNTSHKVHYVDGFSRNSERRAFIPNALFWSEDEKKLGIINILNRFNFTVEESSANDIQVALDPELLGKIFENLLGTFNPETKESARKESGSFYTPREIVSYMVNRSIASYLHEKLPDVSEENIERLTNDDKSDDEAIELTEEQILRIRQALFEIKIIDPACGSGAFPMGILNKLVEIHSLLNKLGANIQSDFNLYIKQGQFINYTPTEDFKINAKYLGNQKFELSINGNVDSKIYNSQELAIHVKEIINEHNKKLNKNTIANLFSQGRIDDGKSFNAIKTKQDIHQIVDADTKEIVWQYKIYNVENKFRQYRNEDNSVNTLFENDDGLLNYDSLYNLKMQIIQDSIFGVDIQPIAVQICKLRFFISLICEQPKTGSIDNNYGYNPLPNLETKFVAANSLIGLSKDEKDCFEYSDDKVLKLKNDLINVRKNHFSAKTVDEKKQNRNEDEKLRKAIIEYLQNKATEINVKKIKELEDRISFFEKEKQKYPIEMVSIEAGEDLFGEISKAKLYDKNEHDRKLIENDLRKVVADLEVEKSRSDKTKTLEALEDLVKWNPYDQTADASSFFDSEWMFGVNNGFDIVIGNPPYISSAMQMANPKLALQREKLTKEKIYKSLYQKWDLYIAFIELGTKLSKENGITTMIVPYPLTNQLYGKILRKMLVEEYDLYELVDLNGTKVFENATVSNCIPFIKKSQTQNKTWISKISTKLLIQRSFLQEHSDLIQDKKNYVWNVTQEKRMQNNHENLHCLGDYCYISYGLRLNSDEKSAKGAFKKADLLSNSQDKIHCRKLIEGKDIEKYRVNKFHYVEWNTERVPSQLVRPTFPEFYEHPKLFCNFLGKLMCTIDSENNFIHTNLLTGCVLWKDLAGVENKSITSSIKKFSKMTRPDMEKLSEEVDLRYLLGVMNSKYASVLLTNLRGGDYHIYPEHIRNIPIPSATKEQQKVIIDIVDEILATKKKDKDADISTLEKEIDKEVYKLYGVTE